MIKGSDTQRKDQTLQELERPLEMPKVGDTIQSIFVWRMYPSSPNKDVAAVVGSHMQVYMLTETLTMML